MPRSRACACLEPLGGQTFPLRNTPGTFLRGIADLYSVVPFLYRKKTRYLHAPPNFTSVPLLGTIYGARFVSLAEEAPDCDAMAKRILVADDSEVIRRQVRTILEPDPDIEICAEAANGLQAVQEVQRCRPDLAVLDFLMPEMNGLEATREIKKIMPTLPVVIFTVENTPQLEWESKQAGADALLPKAEGSRQLSELIHTLLQ